MAVIKLEHISKSYWLDSEELVVLRDISLEIQEGEFVAIMGPSGSGKSTLMQIMGLLDRPTSGTYTLLGKDVSGLSDNSGAAIRSKTIGFIFQMFNLLARTTKNSFSDKSKEPDAPRHDKTQLYSVNAKPPDLTWSEFSEFGMSAVRAIAANKVRSGLSILGILIGVSAVIAMLAIGRGAQKVIEARLQSLGSNVVMLFGGTPSSRGIRGAAGNYSRLTLLDAEAVRTANPSIADLYPEAKGDVEIVCKDQNKVSEMQGVTPNYVSIRNTTPEYGRFFTEEENTTLARVIVICPNVVTKLFGQENPIGKTIKINRVDFKVIGTLPTKGAGSGDQDDMVFVPIRTAMKRVLGTQYLHEMAIQCATPAAIPNVMTAIERLMRHRHHLPFYKENDFRMRNNAEVQTTLSETTRTFSLLLGIVAAISLLVGGVGIINIMLVSVKERTREIGLRKSVGATSRAILLQFLIESIVLSVIGGIIGIILGVGISFLVSKFAGWMVVVTYSSVCLSFAFSASVGIILGFWPARRASQLSPIEALRYE